MARSVVTTLASAVVLSLCLTASRAEARSFVGRKLSGITFVDTEGHTVNPDHYRGSVLVMVAGIPW
jgi:hypothetical protein